MECLSLSMRFHLSLLHYIKRVFSVSIKRCMHAKWMVFQGVNTNIKVKNPLDIVENGDVLLFLFGGLVWKWVQDAKSMISIGEGRGKMDWVFHSLSKKRKRENERERDCKGNGGYCRRERGKHGLGLGKKGSGPLFFC